MKAVDPMEVHAVAAKLLEFLSADTATSLEVQRAALNVASATLLETISINTGNDMKNEARNFWRKR